MVNFVYAIGDRETGECVLVDPAYAVDDLVDTVEADGMTRHRRARHALPPRPRRRLDDGPHDRGRRSPARTGRAARSTCSATRPRGSPAPTGIAEGELVAHEPGDRGRRSARSRSSSSTPRATRRAASASSSTDGWSSGDTLFLDGCGRTDLPGSDPAQMYDSLQRLATLPDDTIVYPGHRYSLPSSATMTAIREQNYVYRPTSREQWLTMFGR